MLLVAPKERKEKIRTQLTRPTFKKIGLNDYCKYISIEDLADFVSKVEDLGGHIQPSIIEKIAIGFGEEI